MFGYIAQVFMSTDIEPVLMSTKAYSFDCTWYILHWLHMIHFAHTCLCVNGLFPGEPGLANSLGFLPARCPSCHPTNRVKALEQHKALSRTQWPGHSYPSFSYRWTPGGRALFRLCWLSVVNFNRPI